MKILDIIWPRLDRLDAEGVKAARKKDLDAIRATDWSKLPSAVDHISKLGEAESARQQSADTKASLYLAVIAAIVPILGSLATDFYKDFSPSTLGVFDSLTTLIFIIGIAYLVRCGIWSFAVVKVAGYVRVDVAELLAAAKHCEPEAHVAQETLAAVRFNRDYVNAKTSSIKMAHAFLVRTFLTFSLLLTLIVIWKPAAAVYGMAAAFAAKLFAC